MYINIIKKINNNKFSNIIEFNNYYYIFGIESKNLKNNINKFIIFFEKYDLNFIFLEKKEINYIFDKSTLIWDIIENNEYFIFLVEQKSIDLKNHNCIFYKYFIFKNNLENFIIHKIEKIELENYLISKIFFDNILGSKIEIDEERPEYYWGKYLFHFKDKDNIFYKPEFDNIVDYSTDKGHLLHYIEEIENINNIFDKKYFIIFSIRHKCDKELNKYYYRIYSSYTKDLRYFYNTNVITINNNITNSEWYCYPEIFKKENKYYILLNQDDFGKEKESLLGELIM